MKSFISKFCVGIVAIGVQFSYAQFVSPTMTGSYLQVYNNENATVVQNNTLNWNTFGGSAGMVYNPVGPGGTQFNNGLQGIVSVANSSLIDTSRILNSAQTMTATSSVGTADVTNIGVTFSTTAVTNVIFTYNFFLTASGFDPVNPIYTYGSAILRNVTDSVDVVNITTSTSATNTSNYTLAAGKTYLLTNRGGGGRLYSGSPTNYSVQSNAALSLRVNPVPEPTTIAALSLGLVGLLKKRTRK